VDGTRAGSGEKRVGKVLLNLSCTYTSFLDKIRCDDGGYSASLELASAIAFEEGGSDLWE
jgi:hypothetical protein